MTTASGRPRRVWTLNGDFLGLRQTGVARYAREVVRALDAHMTEGHPLARDLDAHLVAPCHGDMPLDLQCIPIRVVSEFRVRLPQVWLQVQLPRHVRGGLVSLCNLAPLSVRRQIVCIHDAQTYTVPESYSPAFRLWHRLLLPQLGRRAERVTTVSQLSRQQLSAFGVAELARTVVTYNGADHVHRWCADRVDRSWGRGRPFVLGMARDEAHKNMSLFRRLAAPLDALGLDLALVGRQGAVDDRDNQLGNVLGLGALTDDELASVFQHAFCFLLPSRTEGFGLPAVEAMGCGCPVVLSDIPSLREVCGNAALFAGPDDLGAWIGAIRSLLASSERRADAITAGRNQAARYSWASVAELYLREMAAIDELECQ